MATQQIPIPAEAEIDESGPDGTIEVARGVSYRRLVLVNVMFIGEPGAGDRNWVLVDAGLIGTKALIKGAAEARFGPGARPSAIVLTHGHFDHVGVLEDLAEEWDVPVYAHPAERPYLDGSASYPPPDPSVGGGLIATLSPLFPRSPVDVSARLRILPADGSVPPLPGWRWIHVPGHAPGQVAFWREEDRTLIAGDAFVTTAQESVYSVALQAPEMHGPPMYFTIDWTASRQSVRDLAALEPETAVTGHGRAMRGPAMRLALHRLAERFDEVAVPSGGRYVTDPARAEDGSAYRAP
ncbi:MAG: beta-lactamase domain protein [Enterovirga sp.]|nr:beta-lactamase domain protein [Enterovirga sp.]